MKYPYDTHLHSYHSDGDYSPKEVAQMAKKSGLKGAVLTDHNTIEGVMDFSSTCSKLGLETFAGVEISTQYQGVEIHILGYAKKFNSNIARTGLKQIIRAYDIRMTKMIEILRQGNKTNLTFNEIRGSKNPFDPITKYDIAEALRVERKLSKNKKKELLKLVDHGGPAFVPYSKNFPTPLEACKLIKLAGGVSVLAHPGSIITKWKNGEDNGKIKVSQLINKLMRVGLRGVECRNLIHSKKYENFFIKIAKTNGLLIIGGSDWHGEYHHPERKLGITGSTNLEFKKLKNIL